MTTSVCHRSWLSAVLEFVFVCAIVSTLAISIAYSAILSYDPETSSAADARNYYLPMYFGEDPIANYEHSVRRVLVPFLARSLPDLPAQLFTPGRPFDDQFNAIVKFAVVNLVFMVMTGCVVYYLVRSFEGVPRELGLMASLVYLGLPTVVTMGGIPLVDTGYLFFFGLSALAIKRNNPVLLAVSVLLGVLAKELVFLVLVLVLLAPYSIRNRLRFLIASLPAGLAYGFLTTVITPPSIASYTIGKSLVSLKYAISPNGIIRIFLAFGPVWVLAILGLVKYKPPLVLKRWVWFVPFIFFSIPLTGVTNLSRHLMILYPVIIPLAIIGLKGILIELFHRSQK